MLPIRLTGGHVKREERRGIRIIRLGERMYKVFEKGTWIKLVKLLERILYDYLRRGVISITIASRRHFKPA